MTLSRANHALSGRTVCLWRVRRHARCQESAVRHGLRWGSTDDERWQDWCMRLYIPLVVSDLTGPLVSSKPGAALLQNADGRDATEYEEAAESALEQAAFASLEQCIALNSAPARVVAVASNCNQTAIPDASDRVTGLSWADVESIMADGAEGRTLVARIASSASQLEVDALVQELFELPLSWYDVLEREELALEISS